MMSDTSPRPEHGTRNAGRSRIAILGGGIGSLITAFELSSHAGWQDRHDITIYQMGWRLGGKCASGVNTECADRIQEHGIHVFYGFYENIFRVVRACYDELGRHPDAPLSTWEDALRPMPCVMNSERVDGRWDFWELPCPPNDRVPGDGGELDAPWQYVARILGWVTHAMVRLSRAAERTVEGEAGGGGSLAQLLERGHALARRLAADPSQPPSDSRKVLLGILDRTAGALRRSPVTEALRRLRIAGDLMIAMARGLLADGLIEPPYDWFKIDHLDFREWLSRHGASPETLRSALCEGLYASALCAGARQIGAGTFAHAILRMVFTYKGSVLWQLQAGMADAVVAPLYLVLRRRGVKFEFFHSVHRLELSADRRRVERIVMDRQATPKGVTYEPLVDVRGLPCWPAAPRYEQLIEGERLRIEGHDLEDWWTAWPNVGTVTLEAGRDFDRAVLGISIGAFPYICKELMDDPTNPRLRAMVENVKTTATQALQLWLTPSLSGLGWSGKSPILIPYAAPFDTWGDMSHLLGRERWAAPHPCGSLHYLCAALDDDEPLPPRHDHGYHARQNARVKQNALRWLSESAPGLWPRAASTNAPGELNWHLLVDPEERAGEARLDGQFWTAPANPSDRYVLSAPGTNRYRLRADESGYENLLFAGDWVLTALSIGAVEAATMAGMQAARAIDGRCRKAYGDWLPDRPTPGSAPLRGRTPYLVQDGSLTVPAPIGLDIHAYVFLLDASHERLTALCDRYLNLGGDTVYKPLGPFVILYCATVDNHPEVDRIGWCREKDFGFWVPLLAGTVTRGRFHPDRVVTYTPYIWVDNGAALIAGREVFGFAKQLARLEMPDRAGPDRFSVDALVLPRYSPDAPMAVRRVLEIERRDTGRQEGRRGGRPVLEPAAALGRALGAAAHGMLDLAPFALNYGQTLRREGMRMVFLKQMPDATDGQRACYQAIIEAQLPVLSGFSGGPLDGDRLVRIRRYDSLRIVENLGLDPGAERAEEATLRPRLQGFAKFQSRIEPGVEVWRAA
ncbi:NAD(P)-binding protein [Sorangium sp. So ce185]|uniref:NAD(P)-binding protein n=1 Tax=Sorangium sp. So ce185 TaxID=3133287 RepID=UPI003F62094C